VKNDVEASRERFSWWRILGWLSRNERFHHPFTNYGTLVRLEADFALPKVDRSQFCAPGFIRIPRRSPN
jgi:hypothetical protein